MARTLNQVLATLPVKRRAKIERRACELATLKELRQAVELSTLRRYVEAMGGTLELVAEFPDRPRMVIDQLTPIREKSPSRTQARSKHRAKSRSASKRHAATA